MVLLQACILFGIGLIVVVIQLSVQLFCAEIDSLSVNGIPISDVCINMPTSEGIPCQFNSCCMPQWAVDENMSVLF